MKKIKFITAIYSDLHGSEFGGRPSRGGQYRYSLLSLLKMTDSDFLCYTSDREIDDLKDFFYSQNLIPENKLAFKTFDISDTKFKDLIKNLKNTEEMNRNQRCVEIQYLKFSWWWNEDKSYDYYYWIDAGLSYTGLIPFRHLSNEFGSYRGYFESPLFNNIFLKNLIESTENKFFLIGKENQKNHWSKWVNEKHYNNFESGWHIIGGLFGGKKELWDNVVNLFENYLEKVLSEDKILYMEENIMTLIYYNHLDLFHLETFDTWWHEDERLQGVCIEEHVKTNKSFYKILEEINNLNNV